MLVYYQLSELVANKSLNFELLNLCSSHLGLCASFFFKPSIMNRLQLFTLSGKENENLKILFRLYSVILDANNVRETIPYKNG